MDVVANHGPVTALCYDGKWLLAGVGADIKVYDWKKSELLHTVRVFSKNRIHGLRVSDRHVLAWGGRSVAVIERLSLLEASLVVQEFTALDWVIVAGFGKRDDHAFLLTAHNRMVEIDTATNTVVGGSECSENSILYSGELYTGPSLWVAAGTVLGGVVVWNASTGDIKWQFTQHEGSIFGLGFSTDGNLLVSCSDDRSIIVWNLQTGEKIAQAWGHASRIWKVRFINNNQQILSVGEDCTARVWDLCGAGLVGTKILHGHVGRNVWSCAVSSREDGSVICATGGADGRIKLWDLEDSATHLTWTADEAMKLGHTQSTQFKSYKNVGRDMVLTTSNGHVLTYIAGKWSVLDLQLQAYSVVRKCARHIIVADSAGTVVVFDSANLRNHWVPFSVSLPDKLFDIWGATINGEDALILKCQNSRLSLVLYALETKHITELRLPNSFNVTCIMATDAFLYLGSRLGYMAVYKLGSARQDSLEATQVFRVIPSGDSITALALVNGLLLVTSRCGSYGYYEFPVAGQEQLVCLVENKLQKGSIEGCQVQKNGDVLFYGFRTDRMFIWNATYDYEVVTIPCGGAHRSWALDISLQSESSIRFFFTQAGILNFISTSDKPIAYERSVLSTGTHGREIRGMEFNPQVQGLLATASEDTCVNLAFVNRLCLETKIALRHHTSSVQALHWTPDGKYLCTAGGREELLVWKVTVNEGQVYALLVGRLPTSGGPQDLRIMDFSLILEKNTAESVIYLLACAYSNSLIRLWRLEITVDGTHFDSLDEIVYSDRCLLNIDLVEMGTSVWLLMTSTDGHLVVWQLSQQGQIGVYELRVKLHQSGVRASAIRVSSEGLYHISGGDDNSLASVFVDRDFNVSKQFSSLDAHSSSITAIILTDGLIVSSSADQKLCCRSLHGTLLSTDFTTISDVGVLAIQGNTVVVGGVGIAVYTLTASPKLLNLLAVDP